MRTLSFRTRLLLSFWGVLLIALALPFYSYNHTLKNDLLTEAKSRASDNLAVVSWLLESMEQPMPPRQLDSWITNLGKKLGIRISYIEQGKVIADSDVHFSDLQNLEDHSDRPELKEAADGRLGLDIRFSSTLGTKLIYAAGSMKASKAAPAGILRLAIPFTVVESHHDKMVQSFLVIVFITFAITGVFSYIISGSITSSIRQVSETAEAIGKGDWSKRIRFTPGKEFEPLALSINHMAKNIGTAFDRVTKEKARIEAVFHGMSEGVLVLDAKGRIKRWNNALENIFPDIGTFAGLSVLEATMEPDLQHAVATLQADSTQKHLSVLVQSSNRILEAAVESYRHQTGERRVLIVFHDITEIKRLEKIRRDFVANVSHELRTPVTSIKGYAETLLDAPPKDAGTMRNFLTTIRNNADHMARMIQDLLKLARIEHESGSVVMEAVDVPTVVDECFKSLKLKASAHSIKLGNSLQTGMAVKATRDGLYEILTNLVENAIRHSSRDGSITISAEQGEKWTKIHVTDQGEGIAPGNLERIFERFFRVQRQGGGKEGSSGLGLAICRNLVRNFGGTIQAHSPVNKEDGSGTEFTFTLRSA